MRGDFLPLPAMSREKPEFVLPAMGRRGMGGL